MIRVLLLAWLLAAGSVRADDLPPASTAREITPAERVRVLFDAMRKGVYHSGFPDLGWEHAPALLERAPSRAWLKSYPVNPLSSQRQAGCPEGVMALWLIDGIRKGSRFPSLNPKFTHDKEGRSHQLAIQAYFRWWQKVSKLPARSRAAHDPLAPAKLWWYGGS